MVHLHHGLYGMDDHIYNGMVKNNERDAERK